MAHQQVRFHLAHGVEHDTDHDQQTGAAEKLGHRNGNAHQFLEQDRNDGNGSQEDRAGEGDAAHCLVQEIAGGLARTNARNVTAAFFHIVSDLDFVELCRHPEIGEEQDQQTVKSQIEERTAIQLKPTSARGTAC